MNESVSTIALLDDHILFRKGLTELINQIDGYQVIIEAGNGKEFFNLIENTNLPDLAIVDIAMPEMNGFETVSIIKKQYPSIKTLALSMYESEITIIKMLRSGAKGYLPKEVEPNELKYALDQLVEKGFYYSKSVGELLVSNVTLGTEFKKPKINAREEEFLALACSELTYKEIASQMCLSTRTIDGYRESLFEKLNVKNRVGLVLYAIKNGIFQI